MEQQNLRALLEQLHQELSRTATLDERGHELLAHVRRDIERLDATVPMAAPDAATSPAAAPLSPEEHEEMQGRWQTAVVDFEGSHPVIARGLERMAVILSNFGL